MKNENEVLQRELIRAIHRLGRIHPRRLCCDITQMEFMLLETIRQLNLNTDSDDEEGIPVSELARWLNLAGPAVSRWLRSLERKGLIVRSVRLSDRRSTGVRLTDAGELLLQREKQHFNVFTARIVEEMGQEDVQQMIVLLNRMAEIMQNELQKTVKDNRKGDRHV